MVADLPDGKPLGSPPPMRDVARRGGLPVSAPAAAANGAEDGFALVLGGNLSAAIEQARRATERAAKRAEKERRARIWPPPNRPRLNLRKRLKRRCHNRARRKPVPRILQRRKRRRRKRPPD